MPALRRVRQIVLVIVTLLAMLLPAASAVQAAAPIVVTTYTDEFSNPGPGTGCSLREAIQAANSDLAFGGCPAGGGADQITLPAGAYKLTLAAPESMPNLAVGDLDVDGALTIVGQGSPTINANSIGRVFELTAGDSLTLRGLTLTGGSDQFGGAIRVDSATLSLVDVVVDSNAVTSNVIAEGGGILEGGLGPLVSIVRSRVTRNTAAGTGIGWGGGIFVQSGTLTITDSLISGNSTTGNGGGILFAGASMALTNVTIASNTGLNGDGLFNEGIATIRNSTFTDNGNIIVAGKGGGIYNSGTATLENVTMGANIASSLGGDGGNIYNSGSMSARNTLVDEALTSGNCGGTLPTSNGHNLDYGIFSFEPCFGPGGGNVNGVDPKLGPLQDNGGPTPTRALGSGSGAIDTGITVAATPTDQRGVPRPFGSAPDIGAYERASCGGVLVNVVGTPANDTLTGTSGPDGILGLAGNDVINGLDGNDGLCGGTGNDTLIPGPGLDSVSGGPGIDTVSYASSASGVSVDLRLPTGVATGQGRDTISGVENVIGSAYADVIRGSNANNWLILGAGNDRAYGYGGNDRIDGGPGNDILYGLTGNDALYGGPGNDYLNGGLGRDLCRQNAGSGRRISCER